MKLKLLATLAIATLPSLVHAEPVWKKSGEIAYLCGGVGEDEFARLDALKPSSNLALLLTEGERGAYLSDVLLTVSGARTDVPLMIGSAGPLCVFRMPPGEYDLQAEYKGVVKTRHVSIGSRITSTQIRFGE